MDLKKKSLKNGLNILTELKGFKHWPVCFMMYPHGKQNDPRPREFIGEVYNI